MALSVRTGLCKRVGLRNCRLALLEFRNTYNSIWLIERHGFRPPDAVRQDQRSTAALAA